MNTVHFIAIGGQSMSGIARILLSRGHRITGSDVRASTLTEELKRMGAKIHIGHRAENLGDPDLVVVSSAIHESNPELALAKSRGIPVVHRMDMLLEAVRGKRLIAIAGSHGKTSTTSMISWVLKEAGRDPTYLIGGEIPGEGNSRIGNGDTAVFETDESDGSFLKVHADIAVATNIDDDHLDYWASMDALERGFFQFLDQASLKVVCGDDARLRHYVKGQRIAETYGFCPEAKWRAERYSPSGWGSTADILNGGDVVATLRLRMPGKHNVQNALAAYVACTAWGISSQEVVRHLWTYPGVQRRLQRIGEFGGVLVLDDFAHHPNEIRSTLGAIRNALPGRRIVVVFQPHRYSRTRLLAGEFGKAFMEADVVVVTGIYAGPGEAVQPGVTSNLIREAIEAEGHRSVHYEPQMETAFDLAASLVKPGDVVVTMGAGDVYKGAPYIGQILEKRDQ